MNSMVSHNQFHDTNHVSIVRPHLICQSGLILSVQASAAHYCEPKRSIGPYYSFEVAYPNFDFIIPDPFCFCMDYSVLNDYQIDDGIYSCVPNYVLVSLITKHGGLAGYLINKQIIKITKENRYFTNDFFGELYDLQLR